MKKPTVVALPWCFWWCAHAGWTSLRAVIPQRGHSGVSWHVGSGTKMVGPSNGSSSAHPSAPRRRSSGLRCGYPLAARRYSAVKFLDHDKRYREMDDHMHDWKSETHHEDILEMMQ